MSAKSSTPTAPVYAASAKNRTAVGAVTTTSDDIESGGAADPDEWVPIHPDAVKLFGSSRGTVHMEDIFLYNARHDPEAALELLIAETSSVQSTGTFLGGFQFVAFFLNQPRTDHETASLVLLALGFFMSMYVGIMCVYFTRFLQSLKGEDAELVKIALAETAMIMKMPNHVLVLDVVCLLVSTLILVSVKVSAVASYCLIGFVVLMFMFMVSSFLSTTGKAMIFTLPDGRVVERKVYAAIDKWLERQKAE